MSVLLIFSRLSSVSLHIDKVISIGPSQAVCSLGSKLGTALHQHILPGVYASLILTITRLFRNQ